MIESDVLSWNSKVANAILAQVQGTYLGESRVSIQLPLQSAIIVCKKETRKKNHYHCSTRYLYRDSLRGAVGGTSQQGQLIAYQKRYWGLLGNYLKEVVGVVNPHLARVRLAFGRGQGRLLRQLNGSDGS